MSDRPDPDEVMDDVQRRFGNGSHPMSDPTRDALTSEDEIAHGEAVWERSPGNIVRTGKCAYCDDDWPCRTQRGIDRLLAALSTTPAPLDVERLARAMHPVWFEPTPTTKPDTLTDREWGQLILNVHVRRADAIREAEAIAREYAKPTT